MTWVVLLLLIVFVRCNAPNYKKIVGNWNIDELKAVVTNEQGNILADTTFKNCGEFVFFKITEGLTKDRKGKIQGFVNEPQDIISNGSLIWTSGHWFFEGSTREPQQFGNDIEMMNYTLQTYKVTHRNGKTLTLEHTSWDNTHKQVYKITKQ